MTDEPAPILLQLYSVHQELRADYAGTLHRLRQIGVRNVELYWFAGQPSPTEMRRMFADADIRPMAMHVGLDPLSHSMAEVIEACRILSVRDVVLPWVPRELWDVDGFWRSFGARLNQLGSELHRHGIAFGYHNHDFEFRADRHDLPMRVLLDTTDPALVFWELDTYWVQFAGQNVLDWIAQYGNRLRAIHFKDGRSGRMVELGRGELPWDRIFDHLPALQTKFWILEQEEFPTGDVWREIAGGLAFLVSQRKKVVQAADPASTGLHGA